MKALKASKIRQSSGHDGLKKLNAKKMKIIEFRITREGHESVLGDIVAAL